ncbi:hypothetical protein CA850_24895 [Micromonospora echinospora]|uniref:SMI1/KNR4 family protein n=2 Tax=Micromonospora echinospora TaxID=1877 RepID=A0A1C4ZJI1_MICEC|nr:hypothetical protein CA850_24895 [Micromonospora echinospora]SCF33072.1 hypothetical protein GA0070618_5349 [Micromonospora echinospora]
MFGGERRAAVVEIGVHAARVARGPAGAAGYGERMGVVSYPWWHTRFESVRIDEGASDVAGVALARTELASALVFAEPFVLPPLLAEMLASGVIWCSRTAGDRYAEFGWCGAQMAEISCDYEFADYMPAAVPLAFDGGGGLYLLDARAGRNDGRQPVVWSHSGSLGWHPDDHRLVAPDFESLVWDTSLT